MSLSFIIFRPSFRKYFNDESYVKGCNFTKTSNINPFNEINISYYDKFNDILNMSINMVLCYMIFGSDALVMEMRQSQ